MGGSQQKRGILPTGVVSAKRTTPVPSTPSPTDAIKRHSTLSNLRRVLSTTKRKRVDKASRFDLERYSLIEELTQSKQQTIILSNDISVLEETSIAKLADAEKKTASALARKSKAQTNCTDAVQTIKDCRASEKAAMKDRHAAEIEDLEKKNTAMKDRHAAKIEDLEKKNTNRVNAISASHAAKMAALEKKNTKIVNAIHACHAAEKQSLEEKIRSLKSDLQHQKAVHTRLSTTSKRKTKKLEQAVDRSNKSKVKNQLKATEAMLSKVSIVRKLKQAEMMVARDSDLKRTNKKVVVDLLQKKHQAEENYRKLRERLIDLDEELDLHGHRQVAELFEKSRLAKRNGTRQYPWQMTLLLVESLVTGASPSAIKKLLVIFSQHFSPRKHAMDQPGSKLINKCRTTMKVMAEVCAVIELARADAWGQLFTDASSVGNVKLQDIILDIAENGAFRPIILAAGTVLKDGEGALATCNTVCSTIENSGTHLSGLSSVMTRMYPEKVLEYDLPKEKEMTMAKLIEGHLSSDNASAATATIERIADKVTAAATTLRTLEETDRETAGLPPLPVGAPLTVYRKRCWNHLRCTWVDNV